MRILLVAILFSGALAWADDTSNQVFLDRARSSFDAASPLALVDLPKHFSRSNATCAGRDDRKPVFLVTGRLLSFERSQDPTLGIGYADLKMTSDSKRLTEIDGELSNDGVTLRRSTNGATTSWIVRVLRSTYYGEFGFGGYETFEEYCWVAQ